MVCIPETHIVDGILSVADETEASDIFIGATRVMRRRGFRKPFSVELIERNPGYHIHIIKSISRDTPKSAKTRTAFSGGWPRLIVVLLIGGALTAVCSMLIPDDGHRLVAFVYLLYISISALYLRASHVFFIAALSALAWNFLFIAPKFTFAVDRGEEVFLLVMYFVNAAIIGALTTRLRKNESNLISRSRKLYSLYGLARDLGKANTPGESIDAAEKRISDFFGTPVMIDRSEGTIDRKENRKTGDQDFAMSATELIRLSLARHEYQRLVESAKLNAETDRLYGIMLNLVSHELRTPFTLLSARLPV